MNISSLWEIIFCVGVFGYKFMKTERAKVRERESGRIWYFSFSSIFILPFLLKTSKKKKKIGNFSRLFCQGYFIYSSFGYSLRWWFSKSKSKHCKELGNVCVHVCACVSEKEAGGGGGSKSERDRKFLASLKLTMIYIENPVIERPFAKFIFDQL